MGLNKTLKKIATIAKQQFFLEFFSISYKNLVTVPFYAAFNQERTLTGHTGLHIAAERDLPDIASVLLSNNIEYAAGILKLSTQRSQKGIY